MFQPSPHTILLNLSGLRKLVFALPCGPPTKKQKWDDFSISISALTTHLILKNQNVSPQKIAKWSSDLHKSKKLFTKTWMKPLVCVQKTKSNPSRIIHVICLPRNIALLYASTASEGCEAFPGNTSETWKTILYVHLWPTHTFLLIFYLAPTFCNNGTTFNLEAGIIFTQIKLTCAWFLCKFIIPFWQMFFSILSRNTDHFTDYKSRKD